MSEKRSPFDYINDLSWKKEDLSVNGLDGFSPWLTNRHFAKFVDTIIHANQVNALHHLDPQLQYDYYMQVIRSKKRFSGRKTTSEDLAIAAVGKLIGINKKKARAAVAVLSSAEKERIIAGVTSLEEEGRNAGGRTRKS